MVEEQKTSNNLKTDISLLWLSLFLFLPEAFAPWPVPLFSIFYLFSCYNVKLHVEGDVFGLLIQMIVYSYK